jgi:hypothetical protein
VIFHDDGNATSHFFLSICLVLKLNCSFPKIHHQKCNIILRVFFPFCLFVFCFFVFAFVFVLSFSFDLFVVILHFCDKHYAKIRNIGITGYEIWNAKKGWNKCPLRDFSWWWQCDVALTIVNSLQFRNNFRV